MTGSPEGTRGHTGVYGIVQQIPKKEQSSMFCSWPVSMWPLDLHVDAQLLGPAAFSG